MATTTGPVRRISRTRPQCTRGEFKDVLFYKEDIERHLERKYHPGE
ncbi:hypothetical protein LP419_01440 [Massilia sp. H-1]|nr:hypothetical protein LP419_01440 [Massilia sp. H-1]